MFSLDTVNLHGSTLSIRMQRINHFPGMGEICRKDALARNSQRYNAIIIDQAARQGACIRPHHQSINFIYLHMQGKLNDRREKHGKFV